jgi:hypothetical protein
MYCQIPDFLVIYVVKTILPSIKILNFFAQVSVTVIKDYRGHLFMDPPDPVHCYAKVFLLITNLHHFLKIRSQKEVTKQYLGIPVFLITIFA